MKPGHGHDAFGRRLAPAPAPREPQRDTSIAKDDRLVLRGATATPRHIDIEHNGAPAGQLTLTTINRPTLSFHGTTYEIDAGDGFALTAPREGPALARVTQKILFRPARVRLPDDRHAYLLKRRKDTGELRRGGETLIVLGLRTTPGLRVLLADVRAPAPDVVVLAALAATFLERHRTRSGLVPPENVSKAPVSSSVAGGDN